MTRAQYYKHAPRSMPMKICPYCGDPHRTDEACSEPRTPLPPPGPPAPTPPADAPEPPWVVAAREITTTRNPDIAGIVCHACGEHAAALAQEPPWVVATKHIAAGFGATPDGDGGWGFILGHVREACEAHAAALAQERDMLKRVVAEQGLRLPSEVDELVRERDASCSERETLRAARDECERQFQAKVHEIAMLLNEQDHLTELLRSEREQHARLGEEVVALAQERNRWHAEFDGLAAKLAHLTAEHDQALRALTHWEESWNKDTTRLTAERDKLRAALEFYADPENYFGISFLPDPPCGAFAEDFEELSGDLSHPDGQPWVKPGKLARDALAPTQKEEA